MNASEKSGAISAQEFAHLGVAIVAYVKPVVINDTVAYAIHAADGTPLGVMRDRATAFVALRQHDLEPVSVH